MSEETVVLREHQVFSKELSFDTMKATSVTEQLLSQSDSIANVLANSREL